MMKKINWQQALPAVLLLVGISAIAAIFVFGGSSNGDIARELVDGKPVYSAEEVAVHNTNQDCWLVVDDLVFDMTFFASQHTAPYHCGEDVSENYHRNHGEGIREEMQSVLVGVLEGGSRVSNGQPKTAITPNAELYTEAGSWDVRQLMIVIERDSASLLVIDGSTHTPVGRIHDVGAQPHSQVFSPDGAYTYLISRDGFLSKIDLHTLEPAGVVKVGESSRGTAITENGKFVVVGNYNPENIVILNAKTMEIIKTVDLVDVRGDEIRRSRAGALVEYGNKILVALKDVNGVWMIDTDKPGLPVIDYFWNVGGAGELHDGFITQDGNYFVVSAQDANTVWVLDVHTMRVAGEIPTGKRPHSGPGAQWGDYIFVPAMGEGKITAFNKLSFTPEYIKVGGAGLFIRSYSKDPGYPYVWADSAFDEVINDEVYVIDGATRTLKQTLVPVEGKKALHPEFTYDGKYVYVLSWTGNKVIVYDSHTFEKVAEIDATTPSGIVNVGLRLEEPGV